MDAETPAILNEPVHSGTGLTQASRAFPGKVLGVAPSRGCHGAASTFRNKVASRFPGICPPRVPGHARTAAARFPGTIPGEAPRLFPRSRFPGPPPGVAPEFSHPSRPSGLDPLAQSVFKFPGYPPGTAPNGSTASSPRKQRLAQLRGAPKAAGPRGKGAPKAASNVPQHTAAALRREDSVLYKAPLGRKIFWKPLREGNIAGTIFEEFGNKQERNDGFKKDNTASQNEHVNMAALVDSDVLSRLFVKATPVTTAKPKVEKPIEKQILDPKRAQNISIVIARLPFPPEELARKLHSLDHTGLAPDDIDKIEGVLPLPAEDSSMTAYLNSDSTETLRRVPEQRILPLRPSINYRISSSLQILRLHLQYKLTIEELNRDIATLRTATSQVRNSERFRQVLSVVLRWGNYINHGVASEDNLHIRGFTLGSLLKLTEFKTTIDPSLTSLHFLTANMLHSAPQLNLSRLSEDMSSVLDAAKVSSDAMRMTLASLHQGQKFLDAEVQATRADLAAGFSTALGTLEDRYNRLNEFFEHFGAAVVEVQNDFDVVADEVFSTSRFFGDEAAHQLAGSTKNFQLGAFFITLREFLMKFTECCTEVTTKPKKFEVLLVAATRAVQHQEADGAQLAVDNLAADIAVAVGSMDRGINMKQPEPDKTASEICSTHSLPTALVDVPQPNTGSSTPIIPGQASSRNMPKSRRKSDGDADDSPVGASNWAAKDPRISHLLVCASPSSKTPVEDKIPHWSAHDGYPSTTLVPSGPYEDRKLLMPGSADKANKSEYSPVNSFARRPASHHGLLGEPSRAAQVAANESPLSPSAILCNAEIVRRAGLYNLCVRDASSPVRTTNTLPEPQREEELRKAMKPDEAAE